MLLSRYYKKAVLLPSGIIILGCILYSVYDLTIGPGKNYKSEWLTADSVDMYAIFMVILHCGFLAVLCSTIFLVRFPKVQANPALTFLSWFLLPMIYLGYLLVLLCRSVYHDVDVQGTCIIVLSITLPFILGLILTFIKFRRAIVFTSPI
jgi:hypothetical protein